MRSDGKNLRNPKSQVRGGTGKERQRFIFGRVENEECFKSGVVRGIESKSGGIERRQENYFPFYAPTTLAPLPVSIFGRDFPKMAFLAPHAPTAMDKTAIEKT